MTPAKPDRSATTLWRYNGVTGYWVRERTCTVSDAEAWLQVFRSDAPHETFAVSTERPVAKPAGHVRRIAT
jgi:hypothetical protein